MRVDLRAVSQMAKSAYRYHIKMFLKPNKNPYNRCTLFFFLAGLRFTSIHEPSVVTDTAGYGEVVFAAQETQILGPDKRN